MDPGTLRSVLYRVTLLHIRQTTSMASATRMCRLAFTVGEISFEAQIISLPHSGIPALHLKGDHGRAEAEI